MKNISLAWNILRIALVLFCGYQLFHASMNAFQAERMLRMAQLPAEHHEAMTPSSENIQMVQRVLRRSNPSSLYYAFLLVGLALSPYAPFRDKR